MPASLPPEAHACGAPAAGQAQCFALQLLYPSKDWHPGPSAHGSGGGGGGGTNTVPPPPSSGYYPGDLQSAYNLASAAAAFGPGPSAPTVAIVDAYDDPNAASDLAAYRASLSGATDPNTGIADATIPPLCSSTVTTGCVTFTKLNQSGGTSYPRGNSGWGEEISLDLDMISALCPACNIDLVEASSSSFSNLSQAESEAGSLHPAAITNSYGGSEFSSESSYNSIYSYSSGTAVTVASGDSGYGVEFPAASPGVTAVGGTSLTYSGTGSGLVWDAQTVWSGAGAGCSAYETMPSWQADQGVYSLSSDCNGRQVADISAVADPSTGVAVYDTYNEPGWMVFGGTSVSAQLIGAMYALAAGNGGLQPGPSALYPDSAGGSTGATTGLVSVTAGSDGSCGDYLCEAGSGELSSGYNGPAGLGTPDGVAAFSSSSSTSPSPSFSLAATPTSQTVSPGGSTSYTLTISPSGGFSGSVSLSESGLPSSATATFSPNPATTSSTLSVSTTSSTGAGTYAVTITGTSGSLKSSTSVTLVVQSPTSGTMTVSVSAGTLSTRGHSYKVPLTVTAAAASSGSPISGAAVSLSIFSGSTCSGTVAASGTGTTGSNGQTSFTFSTKQAGTWCASAAVTASGYSTGSGETTFNT
jgi:subtilase family serine protease